jgi:exopolysaccharide biosynthesis polyprenyl glycosylphosphotransferase
MLSHPRKTRTLLAQISDGGLFAIALGIAYALRVNAARWFDLPPLRDLSVYLWLFPWVAVFAPTLLTIQGFYRQPRITSRLGIVLLLLRASMFIVLGTIFMMFFTRAEFARSVIMLVGVFGGFLVYLRHEIGQWSAGNARWQHRVVWLGTAAETERAQSQLTGMERESLQTVATLEAGEVSPPELEDLLHRDAVDAVIASIEGSNTEHLRALLAVVERKGVELVVRTGIPVRSPWRTTVDDFAGESVLHVRPQSASPGALAIKQGVDYLGAAVLLVGLLPIMFCIGVAIKLTSRGPVLFAQQRGGRNGRSFAMLKFRTMRPEAETERAELDAQNELSGPAFKMTDDPRVTPFGRFLRRHSLDELPQLWNVLRGEMSLVGPRPLPLEEVKAIAEGEDRRRLSVNPGMTGLWQISGRSDLADFADWVRLDLAYIDQWSLWLDCKILIATVPVALLGKGSR